MENEKQTAQNGERERSKHETAGHRPVQRLPVQSYS